SPLPPSRQMTRNEILRAAPSAEGEQTKVESVAAHPIDSSILALLLFVALVEILSLSIYPVLRRWITGVGTLALSKTLGVLLFAYASWLVASFGIASFTQSTLVGVLLLFGV